MKVLWITNILFPNICSKIGISASVKRSWMHSLMLSLQQLDKSIEFGIATIYDGPKLLIEEIEGVTYYCIPFKGGCPISYQTILESYWRKIKNLFQPDVVHIHGTEYSHGLAYIKSCGSENVVTSIQGLVSVIYRYSLGGINFEEWERSRTLHDYIKRIDQRRQILNNFKIRGKIEKEYLSSLKFIIGRTDWDRIHTLAANPKIKYFSCNETLRSGFYNSIKWNSEKCIKHRIFLSQVSSPLKGLQMVLKALPLILKYYPDCEIYAAGEDIKMDWIHRTAYAKYILSLMKQNNLSGKVHFLSLLDETKMIEMYLSANVFICPSSIENSSNSLGEAQLLGLPCIASYVGGIPNMIENDVTGLLYRFEEYEMLAAQICRVFSDKKLAENLSIQGRSVALMRHDASTNARQTINIYQEVMLNR